MRRAPHHRRSPRRGLYAEHGQLPGRQSGQRQAAGLFSRRRPRLRCSNHKAALTDMIDRDKNHPSVIAWSLLNEPQCTSRGHRGILQAPVRAGPPPRPPEASPYLYGPDDQCPTPARASVSHFVSLNRYYGSVCTGGAGPADAEAAFRHEMDGWAKVLHGRPLIFTEYGTDNLSGAHKLPQCDVECRVPE